MDKALLPIGTVVLLKGATKKLMITGYYSKAADSNKIYTYNACIFPEGYMENTFCLFDANQIDQVFYKGLENEEFEKYTTNLSPKVGVSSGKGIVNDNNVSLDKQRRNRRVPKAPTNPMSISEMHARFTQKKVSGHSSDIEIVRRGE